MPVDISRVDLLLQYALLVAGESDEEQERQLGPIHLIKYVYLADLAHAARASGVTYTGVDWRFHKFGPWSQEVNARIEPALYAISADKKTFASEFDRENWCRWSLSNATLLKEIESKLNGAIQLKLRTLIKAYGKDTAGLLDYVYRTPPMLNAAPSETLMFVSEGEQDRMGIATYTKAAALTDKKQKQFKSRIDKLRADFQSRKKLPLALIDPVSSRSYDQVYEQGLVWLDSLAGERPEPGEMTVEFSDDVWKSETRKGTDVP